MTGLTNASLKLVKHGLFKDISLLKSEGEPVLGFVALQ